jgi:hypothetical protein
MFSNMLRIKPTYFWSLAIAILGFTPLYILCLYNIPSADDYDLYLSAHRKGFWESNKEVYNTWTGRYFGTSLTIAAQYLKDLGNAYFLIPLIYITCFLLALYFAVYQIFKKRVGISAIYGICFLLAYGYYAYMPSLVETTYWLPGTMLYTTSLIFAFILLGSFFLAINKGLKFLLQTICIICLMGCNEIIIIITLGLLSLTNIIGYFNNKKRDNYLLALLFIALLFALVEMLAPGNYVRMATSSNAKSIIKSFAGSSISTLLIIAKNLPIIIALSFILLFLIPRNYTNNYFSNYRKLFLLNYIGIIFLCYALNYYSSGHLMAPRTENIVFAFVLFGGIFLGYHFLNEIKFFNNQHNSSVIFIKPAILSVVFLMQFFNNRNNITTAYLDIITGQAKGLQQQYAQRHYILKANARKITYIEPLKNLPASLFYKDLAHISQPENVWINQQVAAYYKCTGVWLTQQANTPVSNYNLFKGWLAKK